MLTHKICMLHIISVSLEIRKEQLFKQTAFQILKFSILTKRTHWKSSLFSASLQGVSAYAAHNDASELAEPVFEGSEGRKGTHCMRMHEVTRQTLQA